MSEIDRKRMWTTPRREAANASSWLKNNTRSGSEQPLIDKNKLGNRHVVTNQGKLTLDRMIAVGPKAGKRGAL
jgi:hypothetical protein